MRENFYQIEPFHSCVHLGLKGSKCRMSSWSILEGKEL